MPKCHTVLCCYVLGRWICAASRSLTAYVAQEMGAYRLYTVVPYLVG